MELWVTVEGRKVVGAEKGSEGVLLAVETCNFHWFIFICSSVFCSSP